MSYHNVTHVYWLTNNSNNTVNLNSHPFVYSTSALGIDVLHTVITIATRLPSHNQQLVSTKYAAFFCNLLVYFDRHQGDHVTN